jgi:peptidoglycan/LPS O-acetylase OafA/YrhL
MKYRADIDGLRALVVLPVLFYHADIAIFSGGFVGVDVFFVISGYLITKIITQEISQGEFSLLFPRLKNRLYERGSRLWGWL